MIYCIKSAKRGPEKSSEGNKAPGMGEEVRFLLSDPIAPNSPFGARFEADWSISNGRGSKSWKKVSMGAYSAVISGMTGFDKSF